MKISFWHTLWGLFLLSIKTIYVCANACMYVCMYVCVCMHELNVLKCSQWTCLVQWYCRSCYANPIWQHIKLNKSKQQDIMARRSLRFSANRARINQQPYINARLHQCVLLCCVLYILHTGVGSFFDGGRGGGHWYGWAPSPLLLTPYIYFPLEICLYNTDN